MRKKNRAMEFYRFLCSALIMCYHCQWFAFRDTETAFSGFYACVELFFILSGFLMLRAVRHHASESDHNEPARATTRYMRGRLRQLFPHHVLSWVIVAALDLFLLKRIFPIQIFQVGWQELLLVNVFGFTRDAYINIPCWYLSALLFASLVIYFLLMWNEEAFIRVAAPLILVYCYGTLYDCAGCFAVTIHFTKYAPNLGFLRGLADMTVGCLAYRAYEWMEDVYIENEEVLATLLEAAVFVASAVWMYRGGFGAFDFLFVPLFFAFVISVFRGRSLFTRLFDNRVSDWLGKQSYAYYLNNLVVIYPYMYFFPESSLSAMIWFCVPVCLIVSVITGSAVKRIMA